MTPQSVYSRSIKTLGKIDSFELLDRQNDQDAFGVLDTSSGKILIFEEGISIEGIIIPIKDIIGSKIKEGDTFSAKTVILYTNDREVEIVNEKITGKYKDIFQIASFFIRIIQDAKGIPRR